MKKVTMFQVRSQYSSILPNYIIETPTTLLCEVTGLFGSDDLQLTFSRVSISVLREDLKEKSGRLLCFLTLILCFLIGPRRTVVCSLTISDYGKFYHEVGCTFLEGEQT